MAASRGRHPAITSSTDHRTGRLGVDRTTTVSLVDGLEDQGLVERRRSPQDRRKNIVEPTPAGKACLRQGEKARWAAELRFLARPDEETAATFVRALQMLSTAERVTE